MHADKAVALSPTDPRVHMLRAEILQRLGRADESQREVERALHLAPDLPAVVLPAAMAREARGDSAGAEELLVRAATRHPEDQDVQWFLGLARLQREDLDGAESAFAGLAEAADSTGSEYSAAARMALSVARGADDPARGVPPFVEAVDRNPGLAVSAARTLALAGREQVVRDIARYAAEESPEDGEIGFAYASILQGVGESDRAVAEVERLLATDVGNDVDLAVGLRLVAAAADAERNRFASARERLRVALDLQPAHPQALQLLVRAVIEGRGTKADLDDLRQRITTARDVTESVEYRALLDQLEAGLATATERT